MATIKPTTEELAKPDTISGQAGSFADILVPEDTVLAQKGRDYKVYREVLRDDQCKSTFQQRRDAVISCAWDVQPGGESAIDQQAADSLKAQLDALDWDRITDKMLYAVWYGHAVGECLWGTDGAQIILTDIRVRDRSRFAYDSRRNLYLMREGKYEQMPERKFWTLSTGSDHDDEPYGLGLAHYCYWPVFFKRNDIKFWLTFLEKFASPTVMGKAPAGVLDDVNRRNEVLQQLRKFSTDTAILVPEGVTVELLEASRTGSNTYADMKEAMDAALAKIILSQTMTTDNGSSRSQAEVHEGVRDIVVKSDSDLLSASFAGQVGKWLTEWNFPGAKVPKVWRNTEPSEDLTKRAERDAKIYALGFEPTEDYIKETYGEGWQKKAVQQGITPEEAAQQVAAEFAELGAIAAAKGARRADQQELTEAATRFANRYPDILGKRVQQLLDYAEDSGDYATFRKNLLEMMGEKAPPEMGNPLYRAGMMGRLMGLFRAQRNNGAAQ